MKEIVEVTNYTSVSPITGERRRVVIVKEDGKHRLGFCGIPVKNNSAPVSKPTPLA